MFWWRSLQPRIYFDTPTDGAGGGGEPTKEEPKVEPQLTELSEEQLNMSVAVGDQQFTLGQMINLAQQAGEIEQRLSNLTNRESQLNQLDSTLRLREAALSRLDEPLAKPTAPDPEQDPQGYFRYTYVDPVLNPIKEQLAQITGVIDGLRPSQDAVTLKQQFPDYDKFSPVIEQAMDAIRSKNPAVARTMDNILGRELLYHRAKAASGSAPRPRVKPSHNTLLPAGGRGRDEDGGGEPNRGERAAAIIAKMPRAEFDKYRAALAVNDTEGAVAILRAAESRS